MILADVRDLTLPIVEWFVMEKVVSVVIRKKPTVQKALGISNSNCSQKNGLK